MSRISGPVRAASSPFAITIAIVLAGVFAAATAFAITSDLSATTLFSAGRLRSQSTLSAPAPGASSPVSAILQYISANWDVLTRDMNHCESLADPKARSGIRPVLYLPADLSMPPEVEALRKDCAVDIEHLPAQINGADDAAATHVPHQGLLYLAHPYVVPGGQFNEMYGWDSYFIIRGLLRDNRVELAKGIVDNFFFEIEHYGGVLNANRTYYLTRSQPPFLTSMILAVYDAQKAAGRADLAWLASAYRFAERDYDQWTRAPHLAGDTGLSRYFDRGMGPAPEVLDQTGNYYRGVAQFFLLQEGTRGPDLFQIDRSPDGHAGLTFADTLCDPSSGGGKAAACTPATQIALSDDYFEGDRAMRESGFDVTFRFGPYGADTHHFAPVCLNSLLYKTENDLEEIAKILGRPTDAQRWRQAATRRKQRIDRYLWDQNTGMFFDYDFTKRTRSSYDYATTFYPLWAGLASTEQAAAVVRNLALFEKPGGLATSRTQSGAQWDYPYGWAPIQLLAAEGLRRYGYARDADRISEEFLGTVLLNFGRDRSIREKYDVATRSEETHITAGYTQNVAGFGWTNGVFLELLHESSSAVTETLNKETAQ